MTGTDNDSVTLNVKVSRIYWEGTEEQEHAERMKACRERRAQWGEDDCDLKDGSRSECTHDMAEALETVASKKARGIAP